MTNELTFIKRALQHLNPPAGASILEVGCGTGSNARAIAAEGFDVTGIDADPEKIEAAKEAEQERLHFYLHDIRLPFHINYFDYAFNLFSHFGYYRTDREHSNGIRSVANAIKHQGYLLLDYVNVHAHADDQHAALTLGDFNEMFAYHNLQVQEVFGDYELNAFDLKKSPRLILIGKKK